MDDRSHVGTHPVDLRMEHVFQVGTPSSFQDVAIQVQPQDVLGRDFFQSQSIAPS
jgi:hypothetical protein